MDTKEMDTILTNMPRAEVEKRVLEWMSAHQDFCDFMFDGYLTKPDESETASDINFGRLMQNAMQMNEPERGRGWRRSEKGGDILHWDEVYNKAVEPYEARLPELPMAQVADFADALLTVVIPNVAEEDFFGDDWYGTDYADDLQHIVDAGQKAVLEAVVREDFDAALGERLTAALKVAGNNFSIEGYVDTKWPELISAVKQRMASGLKAEIFDTAMQIDRSGAWVVRKIRFLESVGDVPQAETVMAENLTVEAVRVFKYERLVAEEKWDEALAFVNYCDAVPTAERSLWGTNWGKRRLELARLRGSSELQVKALQELFVKQYDKREHYDVLKQLVGKEKWAAFYPNLLKQAEQEVSAIGPFLVEEQETDWLYRLICRENEASPMSYNQMIAYYAPLASRYGDDLRRRIKAAFLHNARSRFAPGCKCQSEWYTSFCAALGRFRALGAKAEVDELVATFLVEFRTRRNLVSELKALM